MVKRQKEKQYLSATEQRSQQGLRTGAASRSGSGSVGGVNRLPFHCCALTLSPFVDPVCTPQGVVFDSASIVPYLMKHGVDPVTGSAMSSRDLIKLNMDRDDETGKWRCPVMLKPFGERTKVVAVIQRPPGNEANVYSYEAVNELNFKAKNCDDLISGKRFHRVRDVITLQDIGDDEHARLRDIDNFRHMKERRDEAKGGLGTGNVRHSVTAARIMEQIHSNKRRQQEEEKAKAKAKAERERKRTDRGVDEDDPDATSGEARAAKRRRNVCVADLLGVELTTSRAAASLTSTVGAAAGGGRGTELRDATDEEIRRSLFEAMKAKFKSRRSYVRLYTNVGDVDLEVRTDVAPRTSANFLGLVEGGKYDGTVFHRSIRNFMIQGGKNPNKGEEDECLWGGSFDDEFDSRLKHEGPGVLSMANAGPGTNRRQFFLTYKSAPHLDGKHSVFGKVVKGLDVLKTMESIPTDDRDRPKSTIRIIKAEILGPNVVKEAEEYERVRIEKKAELRRKEREERMSSALGMVSKGEKGGGRRAKDGDDEVGVGASDENDGTASGTGSRPGSGTTSLSFGVGKYLPKGALQADDVGAESSDGSTARTKSKDEEEEKKKKRRKGRGGGEGEGEDSFLLSGGGGGAVVVPPASRLPPPPKKTVFGDFSGW